LGSGIGSPKGTEQPPNGKRRENRGYLAGPCLSQAIDLFLPPIPGRLLVKNKIKSTKQSGVFIINIAAFLFDIFLGWV